MNPGDFDETSLKLAFLEGGRDFLKSERKFSRFYFVSVGNDEKNSFYFHIRKGHRQLAKQVEGSFDLRKCHLVAWREINKIKENLFKNPSIMEKLNRTETMMFIIIIIWFNDYQKIAHDCQLDDDIIFFTR